MNLTVASEIGEVMDRVVTWHPSSRILLARRILETLDATDVLSLNNGLTSDGPTRGLPVERALGLLKTDRVPPDDAECRRIVEEERWKKYGS